MLCPFKSGVQGLYSFIPLFNLTALDSSIAEGIQTSIEVCQRYSEKYKDLRYEYLNKATALATRLEAISDTSNLKDHLDNVEKILTEIDEELGKNAKEYQG